MTALPTNVALFRATRPVRGFIPPHAPYWNMRRMVDRQPANDNRPPWAAAGKSLLEPDDWFQHFTGGIVILPLATALLVAWVWTFCRGRR